jgi:DNA-directed RNA polymerase sigma subunit (sigma70/sigma32)
MDLPLCSGVLDRMPGGRSTPGLGCAFDHRLRIAALSNLSDRLGRGPREVRILQLWYGLIDGESYTLELVGHKMGATRERVRQIEGQALSRLRHPAVLRMLRVYLG